MSDNDSPHEPPDYNGPPGCRFSLLNLLVAVTAICFLLALLVPAMHAARESARRSQCNNNLKMIGLGLQGYADVNKRFPGAGVPDAPGSPGLSWRLPVLCHATDGQVWNMYRRYESWTSPHNMALAAKLMGKPYFLVCPSDAAAQNQALASYVMVVGPLTLSSGKTYTPPGAIRDGQHRTIAVAELANTDIPWSEPRDLNWSKMSWQVNDRAQPGVSSHHPGGALVVFIDAHAQFLSNRTDPNALRALFTIAGGEPVDPDDLPLR